MTPPPFDDSTLQQGTFTTELKDGWGLTNDGTHLILTDNSQTVSFIDPKTFKTVKSIVVKDGDRALPWLNEVRMIC